jgi:hypothetical protein
LNLFILLKFALAAVARKIYLRGGNGVGSLTKVYGGAKNNGTKPSHFTRASGSVIRAALKQLEKIQVVEKDPKGYAANYCRFFTNFFAEEEKSHQLDKEIWTELQDNYTRRPLPLLPLSEESYFETCLIRKQKSPMATK